MKRSKSFALDEEVYTELRKEKNPSLLVNNYLKIYFGLNKTSQEKKEETDKQINEDLKVLDMESEWEKQTDMKN